MNDLSLLPNKPTLAQIQALEAVGLEQPQVAIDALHHFAPNVYAREITIPAGVCVVGKLHRHTHLIMLMQGDVTIYTDEGMQRIAGPKVWQSAAGTKRAIFAHEDSTLVTIHPTQETDLAAIEADVILPEHEQLGAQGVLT